MKLFEFMLPIIGFFLVETGYLGRDSIASLRTVKSKVCATLFRQKYMHFPGISGHLINKNVHYA